MSDPIKEIYCLLDEFEAEIAQERSFWKEVRENNPGFEPVSEESCQEKITHMWFHGETETFKCYELERWLYGDPPATKIAQSPALSLYKAWRKWLKIAGIPKFTTCCDYDKKTRSYREVKSEEPSDMYYVADERFDIEKPSKDETLLNYIVRLARSVEEDGQGHRLEFRALKSFVDFIRKNHTTKQVAFLEQIFPQRMKLHGGRIIRLLPLEAYPIPEKTAAEILIELAHRVRSGRQDARHTAMESLALCWLCLTASRIRLPKTLETIRDIKATAVLSGAEFSLSTTPTYGGSKLWRPLVDSDFSVLLVPTWFGEQPLKISNRLAAFLKAVSGIPSKTPRETILQKPRRSLDRMFDKALKAVAPNPEYGNITYLSLLQQPHIFSNHRSQPNYKDSK